MQRRYARLDDLLRVKGSKSTCLKSPGSHDAPNRKTRPDGRQDGRGAGRDAVGCDILRRFASITPSLTEVNCSSLPLAISFSFSPVPLLPALPCLRASYNPPPPGRGTSLLSSIRTGRASIQSASFQSPCPLTHCVRSLMARYLLANGTDDETTNGTKSSDERRGEKRDERRDGRMKRPQV